MKSGPIILIEDDVDDRYIMEEILANLEIPNTLKWFPNCPEALKYLETTTDKPFIILCDVNLPLQTGLQFKRQIDTDPRLRHKSIPFVFYSTVVSKDVVNEAYTEMSVQGFFQKKNSYDAIRANVKLIMDYWGDCYHPNT